MDRTGKMRYNTKDYACAFVRKKQQKKADEIRSVKNKFD